MTSLAKRTLRATVAVSGMAALGAGFAGTAAAAVPMAADSPNSTAVNTAQVDDFNSDNAVAPDSVVNTIAGNMSGSPVAPSMQTAGPSLVEEPRIFQFQMPDQQLQTAGPDADTMFGSMAEHTVPSAAGQPGTDPTESSFGQDNRGPAGTEGATGPASSSADSAASKTMSTVGEKTSNNDPASNHNIIL
ncbi:MAG: hypothetical protein ACRDRH_11905 [Pseudonocardia sp.]